MEAAKSAWIPLGALLMREGLITPEQLEMALVEKEQMGRRVGEILVEWGWVSGRAIARALAEQYEIGFLDLADSELDDEAAAFLPEELARRYQALPVKFLSDDLLLVAITDPTDVAACDELRFFLRASIRLAVVDKADLQRALDRVYGRTARLA